MSYPQPDSDKYALTGGTFFRLSTGLTTPGDIYESQQSAHAFAIGPNSDIANVNIGYFDPQVQTFLNLLQLGPARPWVGRLDARNDVVYTPSGRPGRLLIWPADLYNPTFFPTGFDPNLDTVLSITPIMEVIEFFQPQGSLEASRNDKTYRFQELVFPIRTAYIIVPFWGRRYASIRVANFTHHNLEWDVSGVTYVMDPFFRAIVTPIDSSVTIAADDQHQTLVSDSTNGMFDALVLSTQATPNDGSTPIVITTSDIPRGGI